MTCRSHNSRAVLGRTNLTIVMNTSRGACIKPRQLPEVELHLH